MSNETGDATPEQPTPEPVFCRNCGQELRGRFCSDCGQEQIEARGRSRRLFKELLRDEFQFNSRVSRTVPPLLFKPGFLAQEYLAGRRARYLPPLRAYIFVSVVMFALLALGARQGKFELLPIKGRKPHQQSADSSRASAPTHYTIQVGKDSVAVTQDASMDGAQVRDSLIRGLQQLQRQPDTARGGRQFERAMLAGLLKALQDPQRYTEVLIARCAQGMFVLMPLFALLLKLLYIRRRRLYLEHLIFTLHLHAFVFIMLTLLIGANLAGWGWAQRLAGLLLWTVPVYLLAGMLRFYSQRFGKTLLKFCLLCVAYAVLLVPALVAAVAISVMWL